MKISVAMRSELFLHADIAILVINQYDLLHSERTATTLSPFGEACLLLADSTGDGNCARFL